MSIPYYHKLIKVIKNNNIKIEECNVFVETGLYIGETISDLHFNKYFDDMSKVYSIEIEKKLVDECMQRFSFLKKEKFGIIHGDSSIELDSITKKHSDEKMFFWLDAHYSGGHTGKSEKYGECPIIGELDFLENLNVKPIILIDDTGLFGVQKDYPTIEKVKEKLNSFSFDFKIKIDEDLQTLIAS